VVDEAEGGEAWCASCAVHLGIQIGLVVEVSSCSVSPLVMLVTWAVAFGMEQSLASQLA
jgi:hypothetical protein